RPTSRFPSFSNPRWSSLERTVHGGACGFCVRRRRFRANTADRRACAIVKGRPRCWWRRPATRYSWAMRAVAHDSRSGELLNDSYDLHERLEPGSVADTYRATDRKRSRMVEVTLLRPEFAL